jgi:two-component system, chemotaxis family, sensor kinase CheA
MSEMDEIIREFLVESNEGLDQMDRDLVELEKDPTSSELLASIFRAIHTVKGTSGVLGFPKLESVAHVGESLLSRMRDGKLRLTGEITSALLAMVDAVRSILLEIEKNGQEGDRNYPEVIALVNSFLSGEQQAAPHERMRLGEILVTSGVSDKSIAEALDRQSQGDPRRIGELLVESGEAKPEVVLEALNRQEENRSSTASSIRVDVGLLDKVMNLVGELVLARNQVLQYTATQKDQAFVSTAQRLNLAGRCNENPHAANRERLE